VHRDLLDQAVALAKLDAKGKPRQANLRRAVSSAYYALFHFLVDEACRAIIGRQHTQQGYRHSLGRAFVHTEMKRACTSYRASQLPASIIKPLPRDSQGNYVIASPIRRIAAMFVELQQKRYQADYDLSERFKRSEVLTLIEQVEDHIADFSQLPASDDRRFFLVCLLAWKDLSNR